MKEVSDNSRFGLRVGMIVGFPCAVGMFALAEPILHLLYKDKAEGSEAAKMLMIMCIGIIFLSALQTLTGILQGVDKQMLPVKNLAIGAVGKLVLTYVLVGIRPINVSGGPIGTIAAYVIATVLNHRDLQKQLGIRIDYIETYAKPGFCSVLMGLAAFAAYKLAVSAAQEQYDCTVSGDSRRRCSLRRAGTDDENDQERRDPTPAKGR